MNEMKVACAIHKWSRSEAGSRRDAWILARRLARYLNERKPQPDEEFAWSIVAKGRIGIACFRCTGPGKLSPWAMISISENRLPAAVAKLMHRWAIKGHVTFGERWTMKPADRKTRNKFGD